jgi:hypothetical protein
MDFLKNAFASSAPRKSTSSSPPMSMRWPLVIMMTIVVGAVIWVATTPAPEYIVVAPPVVAPPVAPPVTATDTAIVTDARPTSTATTLGSRSGLGGGPLVGSQSTRLGGSSILPGRRVNVSENRFENRTPRQIEKMTTTVVPSSLPTGPVAPAPTMQSAPRKKQYATFAPPLPYQPVGQIIIDSRDGQIIQPR